MRSISKSPPKLRDIVSTPESPRQVAAIILQVIIVSVTLSVSACGTMMYMNKTYVGYRVIDKKVETETKKVPIRITSCVTPQGYVICERRYGALTECTLQCKVPNRWMERPEGYGGYENKVFTNYYLILESPAGLVEKFKATETQYSGVQTGQMIGESPQ